MNRYFIDAYGPDADAERLGIEWLAREASRQDLPCAVVVPSVDSISSLDRAIGRKAAEFAKKDRYFLLEGVRVQVVTGRTLSAAFAGLLLVPWANGTMVGSAEECRPTAICAIPWAEGDLDDWKRAYDPVDVRTGEPLGEDQVELSPLVTRALVSLTASVNPSTGIHHPSDARQARQFLKALYMTGEPLDSSEIRTWALAHGWQARHAADLAELAGKIAAGKRVKGTAMTKTEAKQIIDRLQAAIDSESQ
ncbi:MAG: DUF1889 family protein [Solirubrobacterales bacterium]